MGAMHRTARRRFLQMSSATLVAAPFLRPTAAAAQPGGGYEVADDPTLSTLVPAAIGGPTPQSPDLLTVRWVLNSRRSAARTC